LLIKGRFAISEEKLFLILFFLKVYSTEAVMGAFFDVCETATGMRVGYLKPILEDVLDKLQVIPRRKVIAMD
jgi:hypothetical protein